MLTTPPYFLVNPFQKKFGLSLSFFLLFIAMVILSATSYYGILLITKNFACHSTSEMLNKEIFVVGRFQGFGAVINIT